MMASSRTDGPRRRPPIRRGQTGFTLIELLVVIVILGILSAVVVFAVRGSGDKGKEAAVATDARTIRTAQEAYCAQAGHYATEAQLTGAAKANDGVNTYKFLSEPSEYHAIGTNPATADQGNCPGPGPNKYQFDCRQPNCGLAQPQALTTTTTVFEGDSGAQCGEPQGWCTAAQPSFQVDGISSLIQLPSGKVLAYVQTPDNFGSVFELFDPTAGSNGEGKWLTVAPPIGYNPYTYVEMVLIEPVVGLDCKERCGSVLVHFSGVAGNARTIRNAWYVYDPAAGLTGTWSGPREDPTFGPFNHLGSSFPGVMQIRGDACGSNCGKILVAYGTGVAELYDPSSNSFTNVGKYHEDGAGGLYNPPRMAALGDGRVLISSYGKSPQLAATLFNPAWTPAPGIVAPFDAAEAPRLRHYDAPAVLRDGSVLHFGTDLGTIPRAEIYVPGPIGGSGKWSLVPSCPGADIEGGRFCYTVAVLPDGKVLATGRSRGTFPVKGEAFVFDTGSRPWSQTGSLIDSQTAGPGVLIKQGRGQCAPNCDKVLAVGEPPGDGGYRRSSAELYTP